MKLPRLRDRDENKQSRDFNTGKQPFKLEYLLIKHSSCEGNYFTQTGKLISVHILQFANQND